MSGDAVEVLFHEGMTNMLTVAAPLMGSLLVVGLVLGIVQSATQIQEPAVGAVPRIATVIGACVFLGPWIVGRLSTFLAHAIERLGDHPF
jgi:flagellar biosynthesis protein FliQ